MWLLMYLLLPLQLVRAFSLNPFDSRSVSARVFGSLDDINEFIGDDPAFYYLRENTAVLDAGRDFNMEQRLGEMLSHYNKPEVRKELEDMPFDTLENELEILNTKLEVIYHKLLEFSRIIVSLTEEDLLEMGEKLANEPEYYQKILSDEIDPLSFFNDWTYTGNSEDESVSALSLTPIDTIESVVFADDGQEYWNPDAEYDWIEDQYISEAPETKLDELIEAAGILKLIKKTIKKIKLIFSLLLKLLKLSKILKLKEIKLCLKIMKTIEKIKKCLLLIKSVILKKIKKCIKGLPFNVLYKIKYVISLILRIIKKILWEIKYIIVEILIKLYYLLKKIKRVPFEIKLYISEEIEKKLGDDERYYEELAKEHSEQAWEDFEEWDDGAHESWRDYNDIETVYNDDIEYAIGSGYKPKELDELFKAQFTTEEYKELERDDFNHEVIYAFRDESRVLSRRSGEIEKHTQDYETDHIVKHVLDFEQRDKLVGRNDNITLQSDTVGSAINTTATATSSDALQISEGQVFIAKGYWSFLQSLLSLLFTRIFI